MNLDDALKTLEDNLRPGMSVECWMLSNGHMMRRVRFNDGETYASNTDEWETAIVATASIAGMPVSIEDYEKAHPECLRREGGQDAEA